MHLSIYRKGYLSWCSLALFIVISLIIGLESDAVPHGLDNTQEITPFSFMLGIYRSYISPVDGDRCPMYPSCSRFAEEAVKDRGITGAFATFDRLLRCGRDLRDYPLTFKRGRPLHYDPVCREPYCKRDESCK